MDDEEARRIKRKHAAVLMDQPGVQGVSLQQDPQGRPRLVLLVDGTANIGGLPKDLDGLPVVIEVSGPIRKQ
jgi:hypothetical protein